MTTLLRTAAAAALLAFGAGRLDAQKRGYVIPAPGGQPRVAGIAPAPAPPRLAHGAGVVRLGETVFGSVPAIVTPDGRVLVNYGYGYEEVGRVCTGYYGYGCQTYGLPISSTPAYGAPVYVPPSYSPPVYGAPSYPSPNYSPAGYVQTVHGLPTSGYGAGGSCPAGYVPTGGYPPCIDPARSSPGNLRPLQAGPAVGAASARPGTHVAPGPRAVPASQPAARVLVRHR